MKQISEEQYLLSCANYDGFCTSCKDIENFGGVEPDAEGYKCESCGKMTVMGIENALMVGAIEIGGEYDFLGEE